MPIQPVNKRLYARFVDMSDIGRCLTRLSANDDCLRVDKAESIYDDFALHRLDRVNDDSYGTRIQGFEGLDGRSESAGEGESGELPVVYLYRRLTTNIQIQDVSGTIQQPSRVFNTK